MGEVEKKVQPQCNKELEIAADFDDNIEMIRKRRPSIFL